MKITGANVNDPRSHGNLADPILMIEVDDFVEEIGTDTIYPKGWRIVPCGPFLAVERRINHEWRDATPEEIGTFNSLGHYTLQLAPVQVLEMVPDGSIIYLTMPVARVRRLLRKYSLENWSLTASEPAALRGRIQWRLELVPPMCYSGAITGEGHCLQPVTATVVYKETHLPLCEKHMKDQQYRLRAARITN